MTHGEVESVLDALLEHRRLMQTMDEQCRSIRAEVRSGDGTVLAEVDGYGALTRLWLSPSAYRGGADSLARAIVQTAAAAARVARDRQSYLVNELVKRLTHASGQPASTFHGNDTTRLGLPAPGL